jgi:hypothetical protein
MVHFSPSGLLGYPPSPYGSRSIGNKQASHTLLAREGFQPFVHFGIGVGQVWRNTQFFSELRVAKAVGNGLFGNKIRPRPISTNKGFVQAEGFASFGLGLVELAKVNARA